MVKGLHLSTKKAKPRSCAENQLWMGSGWEDESFWVCDKTTISLYKNWLSCKTPTPRRPRTQDTHVRGGVINHQKPPKCAPYSFLRLAPGATCEAKQCPRSGVCCERLGRHLSIPTRPEQVSIH